MSVDEIALMEYVDGTASPEVRAEVEAALEKSPDLAEQLVIMRASALPFQAAFDHQALPDVPAQLRSNVERLASKAPRGRERTMLPWLAVAFVAGAFSAGIVFRYLPPVATGSLLAAADMSDSQVSPWVKAVVDYQVLYSRKTLADLVTDRNATARTVDQIRRVDGMPTLSIPDLRAAGLTFKRVQRLSYAGQPLVQIVYLPERGDPVALCAIAETGTDEPAHAEKVGGMDAVTWRRHRLAYVLVAKNDSVDLERLGTQIAQGRTPELAPQLYGSAGV
jgi:anti-sigma factor RsiW